MPKKSASAQWSFVIMIGAVWGLTEAALGLGLERCASLASGSIMTGVALMFMAAGWTLASRKLSLALLVVIAGLFKMFDALLLSLPLHHGAIANPIFAFITEGLAFFILISLASEALKKRVWGQALTGGLAAILAANLFPLGKFATGIPACVYPGTSYPLSLYFLPLAVAVSLIAVPLGIRAGEKIAGFDNQAWLGDRAKSGLAYLAAPLTLVLCLGIMALIRLH
jgi:hypothetical protein